MSGSKRNRLTRQKLRTNFSSGSRLIKLIWTWNCPGTRTSSSTALKNCPGSRKVKSSATKQGSGSQSQNIHGTKFCPGSQKARRKVKNATMPTPTTRVMIPSPQLMGTFLSYFRMLFSSVLIWNPKNRKRHL